MSPALEEVLYIKGKYVEIPEPLGGYALPRDDGFSCYVSKTKDKFVRAVKKRVDDSNFLQSLEKDYEQIEKQLAYARETGASEATQQGIQNTCDAIKAVIKALSEKK